MSNAASVPEFAGYTDSDFRAMQMLLLSVPALQDSGTRKDALHLLARVFRKTQNKVIHEEMAPMLCNSSAATGILLEEVISVYGLLGTERFTRSASIRACDTLALFQAIAIHPDTKRHILEAEIPTYVQPFLIIKTNEKHKEFLRISSLGIIGALMKAEDPDIINSILKSEIYPCFLMSMDYGSIYSKIIATSILKRILKDEDGFKYCCNLPELILMTAQCLGKVIQQLAASKGFAQNQRKRVLQHLVGCYFMLSTNPGACEELGTCFPWQLREASFISVLHDDEESMQCLKQTCDNIEAGQQDRLRQQSQFEQILEAIDFSDSKNNSCGPRCWAT